MPYLPEALNSIFRQSYSDFTLIAIDDGSTDASLEHLRSVRDSRLRVYSQPNRGITSTLNRILELTTTPWLVRQDADDFAYPQRLERTLEFIRRYPEAGMFHSAANYYPAGKCVGRFRNTTASPKGLRALTRAGYLLSICHPAVTLNVLKTRELGGYRFDLSVEDLDLWWRMALTHDIHYIPEVTVGVRTNGGSTCSRNLKRNSVGALFVQYLLLSALLNLVPRSYDEVEPVLETLVSVPRLQFRKNIRNMNIHLGDRHYWRATASGVRAFLWSPPAFVQRVLYEFRKNPVVTYGENPSRFLRISRRLWPGQSSVLFPLPR